MLDAKNIQEINEEKLNELMKLDKLIINLNSENNAYATKYNNDAKSVRIHKRLKEKLLLLDDIKLSSILNQIKQFLDKIILENERLLDNEKLIREK